jgi:hypothetical protein
VSGAPNGLAPALRQSLPAGLAGLLRRCLEADPRDRPESFAEVIEALDESRPPRPRSRPVMKVASDGPEPQFEVDETSDPRTPAASTPASGPRPRRAEEDDDDYYGREYDPDDRDRERRRRRRRPAPRRHRGADLTPVWTGCSVAFTIVFILCLGLRLLRVAEIMSNAFGSITGGGSPPAALPT